MPGGGRCFGTIFQWSDCPNSGIRCGTKQQCSKFGLHKGFPLMYYTCVKVATSSSKYVRSGRKFKINVFFGWFCGSFRNVSVRSCRIFGSLSEVVDMVKPAISGPVRYILVFPSCFWKRSRLPTRLDEQILFRSKILCCFLPLTIEQTFENL